MTATFDLYPLRFRFTASEEVHFPPGQSGNILRGSFGRIFKKLTCRPECADSRNCERRGTCAYARIFEPTSVAGEGPSGLQDRPRPFVFRASHLDGVTVASGENFHFNLHLFETREPVIDHFTRAFAELAREGLGPGRKRAILESVEGHRSLQFEMVSGGERPGRVRVRFLTPTELKGSERPEFGVLFARIRDRVSTLRSLYGSGPLEIDFKAMGERADRIQMTRCDIEQVSVARRSGRTGQTHSLGGFVGVAEYEGDLGEFIPFLEIARWTGVGRQTVWGKGEIAYETR